MLLTIYRRTPYGCVDWNINTPNLRGQGDSSHPIRVRGLKFSLVLPFATSIILSHPIRVRGLKYNPSQFLQSILDVAPHTGAWIEIHHPLCLSWSVGVAPHTGAWIEMLYSFLFEPPPLVAPHTGAWIEILSRYILEVPFLRRTPYGCVDWNIFYLNLFKIF